MEAMLAVLGTVGLLIAIAANVTRVAEFVEARRRSRRAPPGGESPVAGPLDALPVPTDAVGRSDGADDARGARVIRTPDQRVRVFVSSTQNGLTHERTAVRRAIEALRLTPVPFEPGTRRRLPRDLYRAYLEQSDVFVGIYGHRYGSVAPGEEVSGLEDEYERAGGRPRLVYVKRLQGPREARLEALLARAREDARVSYSVFGDARELEVLLVEDLTTLLSERPTASGAVSFGALPAPLDPLFDREAELAQACALVKDPGTRLVTILGPGGIGKSRLALAVAERVGAAAGGRATVYVSLQGVLDADGVLDAIAAAIGLHRARTDLLGGLKVALRPLKLLLVLDNFERVLAAAPMLAELLDAAPGVVMLVTSRARLRLAVERVVALAPLPLPAVADGTREELVRIADADAGVRLFVWRAQAVADIAVDATTAPLLLDIVRRLDGWPLAIVLAAARLGHMSLGQLRDRLSRRLDLLVGGGRDMPDRQQTLRRTIDWSLDLLGPDAGRLLLWLGSFTGGATLEAVERIAARMEAPLRGPAIDAVAELVDHSLVMHDTRGLAPRYVLLGMVHEVAAERLAGSTEVDAVRWAHARVFVELAEGEGLALFHGSTQSYRLLREEEGNLRAAQAWLRERDDVHGLAVLATALWQYWGSLGQQREQLDWIDTLLERAGLDPAERVRLALAGAGMHLQIGAIDRGERLMDEAEPLLAHFPDRRVEVALPLGRAFVAVARRDLVAAAAAATAGLALATAFGSVWAASMASLMLARIALCQDRLEEALGFASDSVAVLGVGSGSQEYARMSVAVIQAVAGRHATAQANVAEGLAAYDEAEYDEGTTTALETAAFVAARAGDDPRAVRLAAAAERARTMLGSSTIEPEASIIAAEMEALRQRSAEAWPQSWAEGEAMPLDVALRYARGGEPAVALQPAA
jgi:predicted ATPase